MKTKLTLLLATAAFTFFATANAQVSFTDVRFSEDFTGIADSAAVTQGNTNFDDTFVNGTASLTAREDTGDLFGGGTSNIYLEVLDNGTSNTAAGWINTGASSGTDFGNLTNYQFSFIDTSDWTGTTNENKAMRLSTASGDSSAYAAQLAFNRGTLTTHNNDTSTYLADTLYTVELVANNSGANETYLGQNIETGTWDVFLNGTSVIANQAFDNSPTSGDTFKAIGFQTFNTPSGVDFLVDDVQVSAIPEPSSIALMGIALVGAWAALRRRK